MEQDVYDAQETRNLLPRPHPRRSRRLLQRFLYATALHPEFLPLISTFTVLTYLISPRLCHRFVGHLEEEAVLTYTRCIEELEAGRLPEWQDKPAPGIAIDYWRLPADATLKDVIYAVRSDETTHRFVNHSLANLKKDDANPFALREPDMTVKGRLIEYVHICAAYEVPY